VPFYFGICIAVATSRGKVKRVAETRERTELRQAMRKQRSVWQAVWRLRHF
jgi:hypothetical protein